MNPAIFISLASGATLGACLRWWLSVKFNHFNEQLIVGTLLANMIACFLLGMYLGSGTEKSVLSPLIKLAFVSGFLGSLSTFSTFIGETHHHLMLRDWLKFWLNFNLQIGLGIGMLQLGKSLGSLCRWT